MSNSPHPCSSMRKGGFLNAARLSVCPPPQCDRGMRTLLVLLEGRVQVVDGLFVDGGHDLVALVVQQPDFDVP